ncbi:MAG: riboflavin synthase subunit alpha [Candidatus Thalassarchaeaceae archaeon]|nr:riboflavin synthase subunit alpha [Candidatus Thalassarchaeaceae archaeon]
MFTGIVMGTGSLLEIEEFTDRIHWKVRIPNGLEQGLEEGASVSLDGVCLTATDIQGDIVGFDLIQETLERTTLSERKMGDLLNVERALRYGEEVGGHLVSGHIMGVGKIASIKLYDGTADLRIQSPESISNYIIEKGYIAVDGISLTIGEVDDSGGFNLHIIPETLRRTTLGTKEIGGTVNLEIDTMTQTVVDTIKRMMHTEGE